MGNLVQSIPYEQLTTTDVTNKTDWVQDEIVYNITIGSLQKWDGSKVVTIETKTVIVKQLEDLPTQVANKITLNDYTKYIIEGNISIGINHIEWGFGSILTSISPFTSSLSYSGTGAMLRNTDKNGAIEKITLIGNESIFEFSNVAQDKSFVCYYNIYMDAATIGTIVGFDDLNMDYAKHINTTKLIVKDVKHFTYSRQLFDSTVSPTYNYLSSAYGSVAAIGEVVLKEANSGIGETGHLYKNISGSPITLASTTDYTANLVWEDVTCFLLQLDSDGGTFEEIAINFCRFQTAVGCIGMHVIESNITINNNAMLMGNSFSGVGLTLEGLDIDNNSKWSIINNNGIKNPIKLAEKTTTEINTIANPGLGYAFFNTDEDKVVVYTSLGWQLLDSTILMLNAFTADFEAGLDGFILINNGTNDWIRNNIDASTGSFSLYISNDAINPGYDSGVGQISHAYVDIAIPLGITSANLEFDWKCEGEVGYDYGRVYKAPTTYIPTAGTLPVSPAVLIGNSQYNNNNAWNTEAIDLGIVDAGTTVRIIFTWNNDGSVGTNPAFMIDNVKLNYTL